MILPFSTQLNSKPTFFVEKIWSGLKANDMLFPGASLESKDRQYYELYNEAPFEYNLKCNPKIHTIREDKNNRWKVGKKIDFFINPRQKNMFRFAPVLPVVSVQKIEIVYYADNEVLIHGVPLKNKIIIDDKRQLTEDQILKLAQNDGFDTVEDFLSYFNKDFKGKLIHWTDLKY